LNLKVGKGAIPTKTKCFSRKCFPIEKLPKYFDPWNPPLDELGIRMLKELERTQKHLQLASARLDLATAKRSSEKSPETDPTQPLFAEQAVALLAVESSSEESEEESTSCSSTRRPETERAQRVAAKEGAARGATEHLDEKSQEESTSSSEKSQERSSIGTPRSKFGTWV
jgi:hypothetical protein